MLLAQMRGEELVDPKVAKAARRQFQRQQKAHRVTQATSEEEAMTSAVESEDVHDESDSEGADGDVDQDEVDDVLYAEELRNPRLLKTFLHFISGFFIGSCFPAIYMT